MKRGDRLKLIEEIIAGGNISSQDELLHIMEGQGIKCTQATLSRDLRRIGVVRFTDDGGTPYYRVVKGGLVAPADAVDLYQKAVISLLWARDILVIKTSPGFAAGVASAIDGEGKQCIAGTVAGDDTIFLVPVEGFSRGDVMTALGDIFPGIDKLRRQ